SARIQIPKSRATRGRRGRAPGERGVRARGWYTDGCNAFRLESVSTLLFLRSTLLSIDKHDNYTFDRFVRELESVSAGWHANARTRIRLSGVRDWRSCL